MTNNANLSDDSTKLASLRERKHGQLDCWVSSSQQGIGFSCYYYLPCRVSYLSARCQMPNHDFGQVSSSNESVKECHCTHKFLRYSCHPLIRPYHAICLPINALPPKVMLPVTPTSYPLPWFRPEWVDAYISEDQSAEVQSLFNMLSTRSPNGPQKSLPLARLCSSMKST